MRLSSVNLADKIVMRPVGALVPYASNSRTHTAEQISLIARSIETFGFTNPILVDGEKGIIAGHARLQAAQKLGLSQVPTIELSWLTPEERQALVIADNQLAITGSGWDPEMLRLELGDLKELGFDLALTGFSDIELGSLIEGKDLGGGGDAPQQILPESWAVIVECADESEQIDLIRRLESEGRKVRGSIG